MSALTIQGFALDARHMGELRPSRGLDAPALRARLEQDGYLYLPGFFDPADVLAARRVLVERLAAAGALAPGTDPLEAVARAGAKVDFGRENHGLARDNAPLQSLLYAGRMIAFHEALLGGPIRHFDMTWVRVTAPGAGTACHTDIVFMGRGTQNLLTAWVPYGDVPRAMGGLAVLEGSHRDRGIREDYASHDVDTFCENLGEEPRDGQPGAGFDPILDHDAENLRRRLGGRWLTTDFAAGDLLLFGMFTAHASLDNRTERWRLSTDSRYQLASEPIDHRWVGEHPVGHTRAGKRGMIC